MRHECISTTLAYHVTRQADDIAAVLWQSEKSTELRNVSLSTADESET